MTEPEVDDYDCDVYAEVADVESTVDWLLPDPGGFSVVAWLEDEPFNPIAWLAA